MEQLFAIALGLHELGFILFLFLCRGWRSLVGILLIQRPFATIVFDVIFIITKLFDIHVLVVLAPEVVAADMILKFTIVLIDTLGW